MSTHEPDPTSPLGRLQLRARRVPWPLRVLLLAPPFVLAIVFVATDSGPYALFADLQAIVLGGEHYLMLSFSLTLIVLLVPAGALVHLLAGLFPEPANPMAQQAVWPPPHAAWPPPQGLPARQAPYPQQPPYPQQSPHPQQASTPLLTPDPGQPPSPGGANDLP